jgi:hypothetical protein
MSANARIPIDLCDTKITLPEALKVLQEFTAEVQQKHFLDDKRQTVYVANLVYLMMNGYIPREGEMTDVDGVKTFQGWVPGMLYNSSRSHVRNGQPEYPNELDYCNVQGHNLEYSAEAWSATKGFLKTKSVYYPQMVETITSTMHRYFNLDAYATRDRGTFGELIRFVDMHERFQLRN